MWNLFKVNSKDTRTTEMASFWCLYCSISHLVLVFLFSIVNFEQVNAGWELSIFSCSFNSILLSPGTAISIKWHFLSVLYSTTMSSLLYWMTWSVWILKSHNILTLSFSTTLAGLWLYHLASPTKPNFLHTSECTILAILSWIIIICIIMYSFIYFDR